MKARDLLEHFLSRADWVDRARTVDRVIAGDPDADADRCLVAWMPGFDVLRLAAGRGIRLVVGHEPTFWDHGNDVPAARPLGAEKARFIAEHGLTVLRLHDTWDRWPEIGIPWAWAGFLGFTGRPAAVGADGYQHRYDIAPVPFAEFARTVAARTASIGEPRVQTVGDPAKPVSKIGVGTGCGCSILKYIEMDCDCCITCDDGSWTWRDMQYAADAGVPAIRVNHGTSEEPGMVTLTRYINETFDGLAAEHVPQGFPFRMVGEG